MENVSEQVKVQLIRLVEGGASREDVATWATAQMQNELPDYSTNDVLWTALEQLAGADLKIGPQEYLHGQADFEAWLTAFAR